MPRRPRAAASACSRISARAFDRACGNCDNCLDPPETWDGDVIAQKALSCVYRTGQRFGVGHLIDVLRGEADDRVNALGHDRLSTFGIGAELDEQQWRGVFRQLVAAGLLATDEEGFGTLRLTEASRAVLRGEAPVRMRKQSRPRANGARARARRHPSARAGISTSRRTKHRCGMPCAICARRIAREQGVPAYVIFHDATLLAMLRERPRTLDALGGISGVGERKLARYGEAFLAALG